MTKNLIDRLCTLAATVSICAVIIAGSAVFSSVTVFADYRNFSVFGVEDDTFSVYLRYYADANRYDNSAIVVGTWGNFKYNSFWRWDLRRAPIPKDAIITKAYVVFKSIYSVTLPLKATFQALAPDGKWETNDSYPNDGFHTNNYINGSSLNAIPVMGIPMDWYIAEPWFPYDREEKEPTYNSPDISSLVQRFVSDTYDPDDPTKGFFGLRCYFLDNYGVTNNRQAWAKPNTDQYSAILHVEWLPPPHHEPEQEPEEGEEYANELNFVIQSPIDDSFEVWPDDGYDLDPGNYYDGCDYRLSEADPPLTNQLSLDRVGWRWRLEGVPRGAVIDHADLTVTVAETFPVTISIGFYQLVPNGEWDDPDTGFSSGTLQPGTGGTVEEQFPPWYTTGQQYTFPHELKGLVQNFVNSTWDDQYNPYYGYLESRNYEYKEGDYFGINGATGGWPRWVYQDPYDSDPPILLNCPNPHQPASLEVDWHKRDYYSATYPMKEDSPYEDTYSDGVNNNCDLDPLLVGGDNKGYWRFMLTVPQYAVIQKASLIYTVGGTIELGNPIFYTLYSHNYGPWHSSTTGCNTWHGSAGFRQKFQKSENPDTYVDVYPNSAALDGIQRNLNSELSYGPDPVWITNDPQESLDITTLVQACVDYSRYEPGEFLGIVLDSVDLDENDQFVEIPKGKLAVYVEWMLLFQ